mmetsp:Transcript_3599/g.7486  ORF Transcript_3599/g.7486 Transcript_3599/m.7486 type:complete len:237 (-) Transcript_3599:299-1009(-)
MHSTERHPLEQARSAERAIARASTSGRPPPARPPRFVRPGVLAQLVKVQKKVKGSSTTKDQKRMHFSGHPFHEEMLNKANQMYAKRLAGIFAKNKRHSESKSHRNAQNTLLELPNDLLMRIVCTLHHDELKPLLQTCSRLRHAAMAAIVVYFNYVTPEPCRALALENTIAMQEPPREFKAAAIKEIARGPRAPRRTHNHRRRYAPSVSPPPAPATTATTDQSPPSSLLEARSLAFC